MPSCLADEQARIIMMSQRRQEARDRGRASRGYRINLKAEFEIRRCAIMILRTLQNEAPAFFSDFEIYPAADRVEAAWIIYHKV